jgi:hypothetical protein
MVTDGTEDTQNRRYFRLEYPPAQAPTIVISVHRFYVIDLSEIGVRFYNPQRIKMPEDLFVAMIKLHSGDPIKVVGRAIRTIDTETSLELVMGIPYKMMLEEQIYLMNTRGKPVRKAAEPD